MSTTSSTGSCNPPPLPRTPALFVCSRVSPKCPAALRRRHDATWRSGGVVGASHKHSSVPAGHRPALHLFLGSEDPERGLVSWLSVPEPRVCVLHGYTGCSLCPKSRRAAGVVQSDHLWRPRAVLQPLSYPPALSGHRLLHLLVTRNDRRDTRLLTRAAFVSYNLVHDFLSALLSPYRSSPLARKLLYSQLDACGHKPPPGRKQHLVPLISRSRSRVCPFHYTLPFPPHHAPTDLSPHSID